MENIVKELTIDLYGPVMRYAAEAHQGDRRTRYLKITVTEDGEPFILPVGADYIAQFKRPDGVTVYVPATMADNVITVELKADTLAKEGRMICDVVIKDTQQGQTLTTQGFEIEIAPMAGSANAIEAGDDIESMEKQIAESLATISAQAKTIAEQKNALDVQAEKIEQLQKDTATAVTAAEYDEISNELHMYHLGSDIQNSPFIVSNAGTAGGGGGDTIKLSNRTVVGSGTSTAMTIVKGSSVHIEFDFYIYDVTGELVDGQAQAMYYINNTLVQYRTIAQGRNGVTFTSEAGGNLAAGTNTIVVRVQDADGNRRSLTYTVSVIDLTLTSTFNNNSPFIETELTSGAVQFNFVPYGGTSLKKTVFFQIDENEPETLETTNSGKTMTKTFTGLSHGNHVLKCWMTAQVNGNEITSNVLKYDFIYVKANGSAVIVASDFDQETVVQGNVITIPYLVYNPAGMSAYVRFTLQYKTIRADTGSEYWETYNSKSIQGEYVVDRTMQQINIKDFPTKDEIRIMIYASGTSTSGTNTAQKTFYLSVQQSEIDLKPLTDSMVLNMDTSGRSNGESSDTIAIWRDTVDSSVRATFTDFNWKTNGWIEDGAGGTPLKISGGAQLTIPFCIFNRNAIGTSGSGLTIDVDFMVDDVSNPAAVLLSCMTAGGPGFEITAEKITFATDLQTISTQFQAGHRVRLTLVADDPTSADRLIRMFTNGVGGSGSGFKGYTTDSLQQANPVYITAKGVGATLYLYSLRVYTVAHTDRDVVANEIAHYDTVAEQVEAHTANEIYSEGTDEVNMYALQEADPDLTVVFLHGKALPSAKVNTDGSVEKVSQVVSGQIIDHDTVLCCSFENQKFEIQGTSSAAYYRKNFKLTLKEITDSNGDVRKGYALERGMLRAQKLCFKKDVASSEQANNTIMAGRYNDVCPYQDPAQVIDENVRQGIYGKPCVIFFVCDDPTSPDYNNGQATFIGKYNMNLDKGSHNCFGFGMTDDNGNELFPLAQSWEFRNNTSDRCLFRVNDFISRDALGDYSWQSDLEARYGPHDDDLDTTQLAILYAWIASTNADNATGADLPARYNVTKMMANAVVYETFADAADNGTVKNVTVTVNGVERAVVKSSRFVTETVTVDGEDYTVMPIDANGAELYYHDKDTATYRQDKFYQEFENYFVKNAVLFYYLWTEYYLMIDNRAKNQFITTFDGVHWFFIPYDFDTQMGINNEGELAFGYGAELSDQIGTSHVSNDQGKSVLWANVEATMSADLASMFSSLENAGYFDPATVDRLFEAHQRAWPMNIWNEDQDWAYGVPHRAGDNTYLPMWQGDKALHRKWWLEHRHPYMCSKYLSASALRDRIQLRTYTPGAGTPSLAYVAADGSLTITPWQDVYVNAKWGSYTVGQRTTAGRVTILEKPAGVGTLNDTETYIYSASCLRDIGNLAPLYVGQCDISMATHLERLILGSELEGYENTNCKTVTVGRNACMKVVDVRGLTALTDILDLSGCENIREIYAERTALSSITLPAGGYLEKLHLPAVKKLTMVSQHYLTDFTCEDFSGVNALRIEDCPGVDLKAILAQCTGLEFARLTDVDWIEDDSTNLERLMACKGIDENDTTTSGAAIVTGRVHIKTVDGDVLTQIKRTFPYLEVTYDVSGVTLHFVNGVNDDGEGGEELFREVLTYGATGYYPYDNAHDEIDMPTLKSTARYVYTFTGWSGSITNVTGSRNVTALYSKEVRKYGVTWKANGQTLKTDANVSHGTSIEWAGDVPTYTGSETDMIFAGWNFTNTDDDGETTTTSDALKYTVVGQTVAEASFIKAAVPAADTPFASCTWGEIVALCRAAYDGTLAAKTGHATLQEYGWQVGDEQTIVTKSGETVVLKIWGFNINEDQSGEKLPVTIGAKYSLAQTRQMNKTARAIYGYSITGGGTEVAATTRDTTYYNTQGAANIEITFTARTYLDNIRVVEGSKEHRFYLNGYRSTENPANRFDVNYFAQEDCPAFTARTGKVELTSAVNFGYTNSAGDTRTITIDGTDGAVKVFDRYTAVTDNNYRAIEFMPGSKITIPMTENGYIVVTGRSLWNGRGFYGSDLRQWLVEEFVDELPAIIQSRLVPVKRITQIGGLDWDDYDTYYDKLIIPTYREVGFGSSTTQPYCNENNTPFPTFANNDMRKLATYRGGSQDAAARVWLSSAHSSHVYGFVSIYLDGSISYGNASNSVAVLPGFCIT